ncbi:ethionine resistance protein [Coemansia sp. RSA 1939]|nr:ethionine resistance protein [Coemansia sp. RSA 1939]
MTTASDAQQGNIPEINERLNSNEATPLLSTSLSDLDITIANNDTKEPYIMAAMREFRFIASKSSLTTLTLLLEFSFFTVNVLIVGHLGAKELGAISLGVTFQVIIAMAPTFGIASAMDTFCSTAFTASRDKTLVGFHLQRGIIAVCTYVALITPILWNAEYLLLLIKQDPEVAHLAGLYLRFHTINALPFGIFELTKRFLQAQGFMEAGTIITSVAAPIHWISCYVFVLSPRFGMGFIGAAIANTISNTLLVIGIIVFTYYSPAAEAWGGWKASAFRNMWVFYKFAIPAIITVCADWFVFDLLALGASYFGPDQLAGSAVMVNAVVNIYHFSNGIGFGVSPRIGNHIGAAKPRQARIAADVSLISAAINVTIGCLLLTLCGDWWISMYTKDPNVVHETKKLIPIACMVVLGDGLNSVLAAILRGLGRQEASSYIFLTGLYGFALPVALYLGYVRHVETAGLWWGTCAGVLIVAVLQFVYIYMFIDWKNEVRIGFLRLQDSSRDNAEGADGLE